MAQRHEVALTLRGGTVVDTWSAYKLTIDMLQPGSAWSFELHRSRVRRSTWELLRARARLGEQLYLWIDGAVQLSGRIERRREEASGHDGARLILSGRDLAGPAISWDADPTISLRGATLEEALLRLFQPLDLRLFVADAAAAAECQALRHRRRSLARRPGRRHRAARPFDGFKIKPGDKVWDVARALCTKAGFLLWTAPHPDDDTTAGWGIGVVIDAPLEAGAASYALYRHVVGDAAAGVFASNMLASAYDAQIQDVPTEVVGFGHTALADGQDARVRTTVFNDALAHPLCVPDLLPQPRFIRPERVRTAGGLERAARDELARANAGFRVYEATVQGHGQVVGGQMNVWAVNRLCRVADELHGLDEDFLVTRVEFAGARDGGTTTRLRLVPKGALRVVPEAL